MFNISMIVGAIAGAALIGAVGYGYNEWFDNPAVVRETTVKVEAAAQARTLAAINEVTDVAQKARAMRRLCRDTGKLYDFETGKCREGGPGPGG